MSDVPNASLNFWCNALLVAIGAVILLGIAMVFPPYLSISYFNFILYGEPGLPAGISSEGAKYITFLYGVLACVMIGWMAAIGLLVHSEMRLGSVLAWKIAVGSMLIWYVPDSLLSIALGYWQNAVSNSALFILLLLPLVKIRPHLN